jgi:hypothetical protein
MVALVGAACAQIRAAARWFTEASLYSSEDLTVPLHVYANPKQRRAQVRRLQALDPVGLGIARRIKSVVFRLEGDGGSPVSSSPDAQAPALPAPVAALVFTPAIAPHTLTVAFPATGSQLPSPLVANEALRTNLPDAEASRLVAAGVRGIYDAGKDHSGSGSGEKTDDGKTDTDGNDGDDNGDGDGGDDDEDDSIAARERRWLAADDFWACASPLAVSLKPLSASVVQLHHSDADLRSPYDDDDGDDDGDGNDDEGGHREQPYWAMRDRATMPASEIFEAQLRKVTSSEDIGSIVRALTMCIYARDDKLIMRLLERNWLTEVPEAAFRVLVDQCHLVGYEPTKRALRSAWAEIRAARDDDEREDPQFKPYDL